MEYWPTKIDWPKFTANYRNPQARWTVSLETSRPEDTGSTNAALSDVYPLLHPHLDEKTAKAIDPLVRSISVCEMDGYNRLDDCPADWQEIGHESIGLVMSPETVQKIVSDFNSVPIDELQQNIASAWPKLSQNSKDYQFSDPGYFENSAEFVEYLAGWHEAFEEAANQHYGIGIVGG